MINMIHKRERKEKSPTDNASWYVIILSLTFFFHFSFWILFKQEMDFTQNYFRYCRLWLFYPLVSEVVGGVREEEFIRVFPTSTRP